MGQHVVYILDLSMITFDLFVGGGGTLSEFYSHFLFSLKVQTMNHQIFNYA